MDDIPKYKNATRIDQLEKINGYNIKDIASILELWAEMRTDGLDWKYISSKKKIRRTNDLNHNLNK